CIPVPSGPRGFKLTLNTDAIEHFDLVAHFHVVAFNADTTFHTVANFRHVILEATQGFQLAFKDHHVVTQDADRLVTVYGALGHHTAGHLTELRRTEHIAHIGNAHDIFAEFRLEHASQGRFHIINQVIDDAVVTQIQAFLLNQALGCSIRTHVETEDNSVGSHGQADVGLGDTAHTRRNNLHLNLVVAQVLQSLGNGFQRTTHVGLEHHIEGLDLVLAHVLEHILELGCLLALQTLLTLTALTEFGQFFGFFLVRHSEEFVTGVRRAVQAQNLDRNGRAGFFHLAPGFVGHGAHLTEEGTSYHHVTLAQGTVLNQHGGNSTTAALKAGFNHNTFRRRIRRRFQLKDFSLQQHRFQQVIDTHTGVRRNRHELNVAAPVFRNHVQRRQLVLDAVRIGFFLVHLVDGNHDENHGRTGVLNGFLGLRHNTVVACHHQDNDDGTLGTTSTHGGKRGVARGIQEGHHAVFSFYMVGTNMLGNTTGFTGSHLGTADMVQQ